MARLFGLIGNDAELSPFVVKTYAGGLRATTPSERPLGWGVGEYHTGEVLLRRRPLDERTVVEWTALAGNVRSDVLIGHVRAPTIGNLRTENTHPFRYRQWLFAHTGTLDGFTAVRERLLTSLPEFLRRDVRGDTDSELFFYVFLAALHEAGKLSDALANAADVRAAIRAANARVEEMSSEVGGSANRGDLLVTNGEILVAAHQAGEMAYRELSTPSDFAALFVDLPEGQRISPPSGSHFSLIAGALERVPAGWVKVPSAMFVTMTRTGSPELEPQ